MVADASTDDGIGTVIDEVRRTEGSLYGLVNIAGGAAPVDMDALDPCHAG